MICGDGSTGATGFRCHQGLHAKSQSARIDLSDVRRQSIDVFIGYRNKKHHTELFNKALEVVDIDEPTSLLSIIDRLSLELLDVC